MADETEHRVVNPVTGGAKGQKLARFDLIPPDALWALAEHFGKGATKYTTTETLCYNDTKKRLGEICTCENKTGAGQPATPNGGTQPRDSVLSATTSSTPRQNAPPVTLIGSPPSPDCARSVMTETSKTGTPGMPNDKRKTTSIGVPKTRITEIDTARNTALDPKPSSATATVQGRTGCLPLDLPGQMRSGSSRNRAEDAPSAVGHQIEHPSTLTTTTPQENSVGFCAENATRDSDYSVTLKTLLNAHSSTCAVVTRQMVDTGTGVEVTVLGDRNWELGLDFSLSFAAAQRHLWQWWNGEDDDEDGLGSSHLIAAAWHMFTLFHSMTTHPEMDDRPDVHQNEDETEVEKFHRTVDEMLRDIAETTPPPLPVDPLPYLPYVPPAWPWTAQPPPYRPTEIWCTGWDNHS